MWQAAILVQGLYTTNCTHVTGSYCVTKHFIQQTVHTWQAAILIQTLYTTMNIHSMNAAKMKALQNKTLKKTRQIAQNVVL